MSGDLKTKGQCLCGNIHFSIHAEALRFVQCHCKDCQRASGTGHMSLAFFNEDDVKIEGEAHSHAATADSGNINTRYFCPNCGSRVYSRNSARPGLMTIAVGCIDDNSAYSANAVVYCKERAEWDVTSTDIPNFEAMPPPPPAK
ncbi:MAG: hypothetical protein ACI8P9_001959 [Parasphingorhabdus sp.]|jgi:hypothetical protein